MSKGGKRASMVALPQPAANGSLCGGRSELGGRDDDGVRLGGVASGGLRKRSKAECCAYEGSFLLNSAYRLSGMKA